MSDVYEAWKMPRGTIVVRIADGVKRIKAEVLSEHPTLEEAQHEAARLNGEAWLASRPADVPRMVWGDDWTERLLAILDKPYELELRAAA